MLLILYYYKCHTYFNSFTFLGIFVRKVTYLYRETLWKGLVQFYIYWRHSQIKSEINAAKLINSSLQSSSFMLFTRSFLPSFRIHMPNIWRSYLNNKGNYPMKNTSLYTNVFLLYGVVWLTYWKESILRTFCVSAFL